MESFNLLILGLAIFAVSALFLAALRTAREDEFVSYEEARELVPGLSEDTFDRLDGDGDGLVALRTLAVLRENSDMVPGE